MSLYNIKKYRTEMRLVIRLLSQHGFIDIKGIQRIKRKARNYNFVRYFTHILFSQILDSNLR